MPWFQTKKGALVHGTFLRGPRPHWDARQVDRELAPLSERAFGSHLGVTLLLSGKSLDHRFLQSLRYTLPRASYVDLSSTDCSDSWLRTIRRARRLILLNLDNTIVSINGLMHLIRLPRLGLVTAYNTKVTPDDLQSLRAAGVRFETRLAPPTKHLFSKPE
jgi:hypothetical protein